jgi:nicotinamidase-related amidase
MVSLPSAQDMAAVVANAARLITAFRDVGHLVVLTKADLNHPPAGRTAVAGRSRPTVPDGALALVPEIGTASSDVVLERRGWSAFARTTLDDLLRDREITQIVLVGLATNYGIESTARQAYDLGYNVVIVSDAVNNPQAEGHEHSMTRVFPSLAQISTTADVLTAVAGSGPVRVAGSG